MLCSGLVPSYYIKRIKKHVEQDTVKYSATQYSSNWFRTHHQYIPFLGVLWGEVRGEERRDEAFDWLSSGSFRCLSRPSSERDKILWRDWGDWAPTDTKTSSHYKQVTSRGHSNDTRIQIICGSKTRESSYQMVVTLCQVISCDHDFH